MGNSLTVRNAGEGEAIAILRDQYTIKASGAETGGAYMLIEAVIPPGGGVPPHVHRREDESFYVIEGEMTFQSEGREIVLGPGGFIHLPRDQAHRFQNNGLKAARMLIHSNPAGIEDYFREAGYAIADRARPPEAPEAEAIQRLISLAPKYGIEIQAPG